MFTRLTFSGAAPILEELESPLTASFGDRLQISLQAGGMHLLARPAGSVSDRELVRLAEAHGTAPTPLSAHTLTGDCGPGLLLSFTNIPEARAAAAAEVLFRAIGDRLADVAGRSR